MEQKDILEPSFLFLGFNLRKVSFNKLQDELLKEVRISICDTKYNKNDAVFSLGLKVEIEYEKNKDNEFLYAAGFSINDNELVEKLNSKVDSNQVMTLFIASLFPFIRQNILSITNDTSEPINLPTIDCRMISIENTLVLSKEQPTPSE